jgi:serine/threonine protein kinase
MTTAPVDRLRAALEGRYRIERELGQGGMATVYLAHDLRHARQVAIKVLRPDLAAVIGAERFLREIKTLAPLQHPHILGLIDSGEVEGTAYYVMPYVDGESLRQRLLRERYLPIAEAIRIATDVAAALDYAHRHGVIHRDIKPENVLLHEGEVMLADFGIALAAKEAGGSRLTETGLSLGTPQYMSPEQATGERSQDARTDVYSLAAMVYEMLAGEPPFSGPTAQAVIAKLMTERPTRLRVVRDTVPESVDAAVAKALSKVPADRYPSAGGFAAALSADSTTWAASTRKLLFGRRVAVGTGAILLLAAAGIALSRTDHSASAPPALRRQITFSGRIDYPILSPDASHVAYIEHRDCAGEPECRSDIVVQEASAEGPRRVIGSVREGAVYAWSPDSRRLLAVDLDGTAATIAMLNVLSGERKELGARQAIWTASPDTMLTWHSGAERERVWIKRVVGAELTPLDSFAFGPTWMIIGIRASPDGRWLAVQHTGSSLTSSIAILDRRGTVRDSIRNVAGLIQNVAGLVEWSSASDRLYYRLEDPQVLESELFRQRIDRQTGRRVGRPVSLGRFRGGWMHVAAGALVFDETGPAEGAVWALERRGDRDPWKARALQRSTAHGSAVISRDGSRVIGYRMQNSGDTVVLRITSTPFTAGDTVSRPVVLPGGRWFQVSPDGRRAVVVYRSDEAPVRLYDLDQGTGRNLGVPPTATGGIVHWMADDRFVWLPTVPGDILVLDARWKVQRRIPWPDSLGVPAIASPAPGAPEIAIITVRPAGDTVGVGVYRVPIDSGAIHVIARSVPLQVWWLAELPRWTDDGWIYLPFRDPGRGGRVFRVRVTDGRVEDQGPPPVKGGVLEGFSMSEDGRRAVEWIANRSRDVVLIRDFDLE